MRSDYHGGIFGHFGALKGAPVVMDGWCTTPGKGPGRTNQEDCADDRFQVKVTLFPYKKACKARSGYLVGIFGHVGALKGSHGVIDE